MNIIRAASKEQTEVVQTIETMSVILFEDEDNQRIGEITERNDGRFEPVFELPNGQTIDLVQTTGGIPFETQEIAEMACIVQYQVTYGENPNLDNYNP